jgi:hypothetical protein
MSVSYIETSNEKNDFDGNEQNVLNLNDDSQLSDSNSKIADEFFNQDARLAGSSISHAMSAVEICDMQNEVIELKVLVVRLRESIYASRTLLKRIKLDDQYQTAKCDLEEVRELLQAASNLSEKFETNTSIQTIYSKDKI